MGQGACDSWNVQVSQPLLHRARLRRLISEYHTKPSAKPKRPNRICIEVGLCSRSHLNMGDR